MMVRGQCVVLWCGPAPQLFLPSRTSSIGFRRAERLHNQMYARRLIKIQFSTTSNKTILCYISRIECLRESLVAFSLRILVVDDNEPWRRHVCSILTKRKELSVVAEVADGLEAVQKAQELQPDLILLDISLPHLSGLEAAKRIRQVAPKSAILFLTQMSDKDIEEEALSTGAQGYILKIDAARELLTAVEVLVGDNFVSSGI